MHWDWVEAMQILIYKKIKTVLFYSKAWEVEIKSKFEKEINIELNEYKKHGWKTLIY